MQPPLEHSDAWLAGGALRALPAWLASLSAHLLLAITGCLVVGLSGSGREEAEVSRGAEIVLARHDAGVTRYFSDDRPPGETPQGQRPVVNAADTPSPALSGENGGLAALNSPPPLAPGIQLPDRVGELPAGEAILGGLLPGRKPGMVRLPGSAADEAAILEEDARIPREKLPTGPTAQLSLFGSGVAEGRSFAFVIDRSNSMGGQGLGAIQAAAKELASHIDRLSSQQTFQVVAYNETPLFLTERELLPATPENKERLIHFVAHLPAFGQTEHWRGLVSALRMKPEVIFLFTDGGDPALTAGQLREIRQEAAGRTAIHCLHFGRGPKSGEASFLVRLAAENRGTYVYVGL
jgi:hypothetical protein